MRPLTTNVGLANRTAGGPDAVLQMIEDLCAGDFSTVEDVVSKKSLAEHAAKYKSIAGFSIEDLNARPKMIAEGARLY